jgi:hypothetical protein
VDDEAPAVVVVAPSEERLIVPLPKRLVVTV